MGASPVCGTLRAGADAVAVAVAVLNGGLPPIISILSAQDRVDLRTIAYDFGESTSAFGES